MGIIVQCTCHIIICDPIFQTLLGFFCDHVLWYFSSSSLENFTAGPCKEKRKTITTVVLITAFVAVAAELSLTDWYID